MRKADYQLRHQLFGQQGSMWEHQASPEARTQIRGIVKEGGSAATLTELDQIAAGAINSDRVLVEDVYFRFVDGNFAVVGRHQREYSHTEATLDDGSLLHVAYRPNTATTSTDPLPTRLARISEDFLAAVLRDQGTLATGNDWYLIPVPGNITPLVISGRDPDVYLVNGIDFVARDGYIAMPDDPARTLPIGLVRVYSAYKRVPSPNAYVLAAPRVRRGSKYLMEYAYKSQALVIFKRAAAEYAGLFVFPRADVVLRAVELGTDHWVYSMASAGTVEIRYPHTPLTRDQEVSPGDIISGDFEMIVSDYNGSGDPKQTAGAAWGGSFSLNGILPVNGLTWDGGAVTLTSTLSDPVTGKPHLRPQFDGDIDELLRFWEFQRLHEAKTGVFLYDYLGEPALPAVVDFWALLETFYKTQLILVLFGDHGPAINVRLQSFVYEHRPKACNVLVGAMMDLPYEVEVDAYGIPLLDERGAYVPIGGTESPIGGPPGIPFYYGEEELHYGDDQLVY